MQLQQIFLGMGEESFGQLLRSISLGKLKTFQLFDRLKTRLHLTKLNTETLRKVAPRAFERLRDDDTEGGEDFATEISQCILISHLDMIKAVLDELTIPHEDGFFPKDLDATKHLTDGWQDRVFDRFKDTYPRALLLFYINHLNWELTKSTVLYLPQTVEVTAS
jgi:hypothetical protein